MTSDEILKSYYDEVCPLCKKYNRLPAKSETVSGGKLMSYTFECEYCLSLYVVGFERLRMPIKSEIVVDNFNK